MTAGDSPGNESAQVPGRLLDYYLHTALAASRHFDSGFSANRRPPPGRPPAHAPDLSTLGPAGGWLEAERANLHAAADYAAGQARSLYAIAIPAAMGGFLAARGHWDQFAALHQTALAAARQAGDPLGEAHTLAGLGLLRRESGDYPAAAASLARALVLYGEAGDLPGQGYTLIMVGSVHVLTGDYPAAAASLHRALALARGAGDRLVESEALQNLGTLQQLGTTRPPLPATSKPWRCPATSATYMGRPMPSTTSANFPRGPRPPARPVSVTPRHWPSPKTSARHWRKRAHRKESAIATFKAATPAKPPRICGRHLRSTSASDPPAPSASAKPCANMD